MAAPVRDHKGGARPTTLSSSLSNSALSFTVASGGGTGFPDGSSGVFIVALDATLVGEEKVLCSSRTADTFTVAVGGRGYDDTVPSIHSAPSATVSHTYSAIEANEANAHIQATTAVHGIADTTALLTSTAADAAYQSKAATQASTVSTTESTASAAYVDLTTVMAVTATIPASGRALVLLSYWHNNTVADAAGVASVAVSGASTVAATDNFSAIARYPTVATSVSASASLMLTGLTPGSNTFTMKFRVTGGTGSFSFRRMVVIPL